MPGQMITAVVVLDAMARGVQKDALLALPRQTMRLPWHVERIFVSTLLFVWNMLVTYTSCTGVSVTTDMIKG